MTTTRLFAIVTAGVAFVAVARPAHALPQFARKYKMDCSGCHDALALPRLNATGYKFRRAGFRMPENIGKEELADYTVDNYFGLRAQVENATQADSTGGSTSWTNTFAGEVGVYPLTGSFAKYFASQVELTLAPDESPEIENAYGRVVYGDENLWFTARVGIFHAFEGLGASDRQLGPSRPLIFDLTPFRNQDTLMRMVELDRIGVDVGVQWENTSLSIEVVNRARPEVADGAIAPAATTPDAGGGKDLIVVANQILGERSGLSAYWAHGRVPLPVDPAGYVAGTSTDTFDDRYDKLALFASVGTGEVLGLVGAQLGFDQALDAAAGTKSRFTSAGAFAEGNYALSAHCVSYLRLDYFNPDTGASANQILGGTLGAVLWQPMVSVVPELTVRRSDADTSYGLVVMGRVIY